MKPVLEMAREAGFMKTVQGGAEVSMASMDCLERFAEMVRADEREACAMWAWSAVLSMTDSDTADKVLAAIRARRKK